MTARMNGINRRVPDTTLRDALCMVEPDETAPAPERGPAPPCLEPSAHGLVPVTPSLLPGPRARAAPFADQQ